MIISHEHRFIFLRTLKTAGKSVSAAIASRLPEGDVVINKPEHRERIHIPKNSVRRLMPTIFGLAHHARARDVRAVLGAKTFDSYFKFAIERNPWDRQVSFYHHRRTRQGQADRNLSRDLLNPMYRMLHTWRVWNWDVYAIDGTVVADEIIDYRHLDTLLPHLFERIGIGTGIELPRLNAGNKTDHRHYSYSYTAEARDFVRQTYAGEIETFGYGFEDQSGRGLDLPGSEPDGGVLWQRAGVAA